MAQVADMKVVVEVEEAATKPEGKRKQYAIGAGKGLGVLLSVALTAYLSVQEAISDRPTKAEVKDDIAEIKASHQETRSYQMATNTKTEDKIEALDEEVDTIEDAVIENGGKIDALDKKVSDGFKDIKEELRYLRRNR